MTFTLARVSAAVAVTVKDLTWCRHELSVRLEEKRGKVLDRPCHHLPAENLTRYLELIGFDGDHPLVPLFQVSTQTFSECPLRDDNARDMIKRHCKAVGFTKNITPHSFRGSGITALLEADVPLDQVRDTAGHSSTKITEIYDGRPA